MHDLVYLRDLLIILSFAVIVLFVFERLKLPAIAGFILTGTLLGPQSFGLIDSAKQVEILAEIGVALLLFGIGVELALSKLQRLWRLVVIGGTLQVGLTTLIAYFVSKLFDLNNSQSIFIGIVIALSSTAIVLRGLQLRNEVDAPHGRLILGILVFQDFSVVPAMLIIPLLIGVTGLSTGSIILTLSKSFGIIIAILLLALLIVPRILKLIAKTRQRQLFILTVFVICIGTAWLVTQSGASLPIGAFLAGLVVSGSDYRHQAMSDMIPFREIFSGLFFVSIGMLISPLIIFDNFISIIGLLFLIIIGKAIIVFVTALIMRMPLRACLISALALAQVGEFSFILLYSIKGSDLITPSFGNILMSAAIMSMFLTPFAMSFAPRLAAGLGKFSIFSKLTEINTAEEGSQSVKDFKNHVIIAGYGFAGRELSMALKNCKIPFLIIDLNSNNVKIAAEETGQAYYGDVTSDGVLNKLGINKAKELVLLINDATASEHAVRVARSLSSDIFITVRTPYLQDVNSLLEAGANDVIASEREAAIQVSSQVLKRNRIETKLLEETTNAIRSHIEDDN